MRKLLKCAVFTVITIIALTLSSETTSALHDCSPLSSAPDFPGAIACQDLNANGDSDSDPRSDQIRFIVIHATDGSTTDGAVDTLLIRNLVSAHYIVDHAGVIIQMVKEDQVAFHAANLEFNRQSIGVEHVGLSGQPNLGHTNEQFQDLLHISGVLVSHLADKYGIPKVRITRQQLIDAETNGQPFPSGIIAHADIPNAHPETQAPHPIEDANAVSHMHHSHSTGNFCPGHWGGHSCHTDPGSTWDWIRYQQILDGFPVPLLPIPLDVFLLVDLSGSFSDDLPQFKAQAPGLIASLRSTNPNIRFGLGSYEDYPIFPFGDAPSGDVAYRRNVDLTFDTAAVEAAINGLFTRFGGDGPQSQLPALYQAATGAGQDLSGVGFPGASIPSGQEANFRNGATKLFLLWTDAPFHNPGDPGSIPYPGPSFSETVDAILALDPPKVIGISSGPFGSSDLQRMAQATDALASADGVDCDGDGNIDIFEGEPLVCAIASSGAGIGEAITSLIEAAAEINEPPIADAGVDQTVEWTTSGAEVTLDGSGSSDADGDELTYTWTGSFIEGGGTVAGVSPTVTLPSLGEHIITLEVNDGTVDSDPDTVTITVVDTTPPSVTAALVPAGEVDDDEGVFRVEFSCNDTCDENPTITSAMLNGVPVTNGQLVQLELDDDEQEVEEDDGVLQIAASSFELVATCEDASENTGTATAIPSFAEGDDDDEGESEDEDEDDEDGDDEDGEEEGDDD